MNPAFLVAICRIYPTHIDASIKASHPIVV